MGTLSCGYQKLLLKSKSHVNNLKDLSLHYLQAVTMVTGSGSRSKKLYWFSSLQFGKPQGSPSLDNFL